MTNGVMGLISFNGKYLLIKRKDLEIWTLPGGRIELRENRKEALEREVKEETGVNLAAIFPADSWSCKIPFIKDEWTDIYVGTTKTKKLKLQSSEVIEAGWFTYSEMMDLIPPYLKKILAHLVYNQGKVLELNWFGWAIAFKYLKSKVLG